MRQKQIPLVSLASAWGTTPAWGATPARGATPAWGATPASGAKNGACAPFFDSAIVYPTCLSPWKACIQAAAKLVWSCPLPIKMQSKS
jgi:hypothetical protein